MQQARKYISKNGNTAIDAIFWDGDIATALEIKKMLRHDNVAATKKHLFINGNHVLPNHWIIQPAFSGFRVFSPGGFRDRFELLACQMDIFKCDAGKK